MKDVTMLWLARQVQNDPFFPSGLLRSTVHGRGWRFAADPDRKTLAFIARLDMAL